MVALTGLQPAKPPVLSGQAVAFATRSQGGNGRIAETSTPKTLRFECSGCSNSRLCHDAEMVSHRSWRLLTNPL